MMNFTIRHSTRLPSLALAALLALPALAAAQDAPIAPFAAEYDVIRNGKTLGSNRIELRHQGDSWRYSGTTAGEHGMAALVGFRIEQQLEFHWRDGMPQPLASSYDQQATLGSRRVDVNYDWNAGHYRLTDRKGEHEHSLPAGTVDRYASGLAVAARLASGATDFTLPVAHADGIRQWRFKVTGEETVATPSGAIKAVRIMRVRDDNDRTTTSWHDPARDYVAVRLLQEEDGDTIETLLRSYSRR
jgi:hypothetical protein